MQKSASEPHIFPLYNEPKAGAASSTRLILYFKDIFFKSTKLAGFYRCTGIMALVLFVISFSIELISMFQDSLSISAKTGVAPK